jgi:hypothetical protein
MISLDAMPVPLANNKGVAWVDACDQKAALAYKWSLHAAGQNAKYASARIPSAAGGKKIFLHRLVAQLAGTLSTFIDHVDGYGLNCTRANLRKATRAQNNSNRRLLRNNTSRYIGVSWHEPANKWGVKLSVGNKSRYLGVFEDITVAARVYDAWAKAHRGEFAVLNFPEDSNA